MTADPIALPYGSTAWFASLRNVIGAHAGSGSEDGQAPTLMVQLTGTDGPDGRRLCHVQEFTEGRLTDWRPATADDTYDFELLRPIDVDRDDLLARRVGAEVAAVTQMRTGPGSPAVDLLGIDGTLVSIHPIAPRDLTMVARLELTHSPVGDFSVDLVVDGPRLESDWTLRRDADLNIVGSYWEVLRWLHDPRENLGDIMMRGDASGPIECLSAIEGLVSTPESGGGGLSIEVLDAMQEFGEIRSSAAYTDIIDLVDDLTE